MTPESADHWFQLGLARLDEGSPAQAERCFRRVLEVEPGHAKARVNLGAILQRAGKPAQAEQFYREALNAIPGLAQAWFNLGTLLFDRKVPVEALQCFRRAVSLDANQAGWQAALGWMLKEAGDTEAAVAALRRVVELDPESQPAWSGILSAMCDAADMTPQRIFEAHAAWGRRQQRALRAATHDNDPAPERRLRLGYLAADFDDASIARLVEPALAGHASADFEVICYSDAQAETDSCWRLRRLAAVWHATAQLSNDQLAERIREDRIDILVDLTGHDADGRRMLMLVQKPAPIQVSWLGYPGTTGLPEMDYRIADWRSCPEGMERLHVERLVRLPTSQWCFAAPVAPLEGLPAPTPPPAAIAATVTFGAFRALNAISRRSVALWAGALRNVPGSRMLVAARGAKDFPGLLAERFRAEGIDPARVEILELPAAASFLSLYARIDIALDAWPCAGVASTLESLWMGVPVLTVQGRTEASSRAARVLAVLALDDLVAADEADFAGRAAVLAADEARLAALRQELRPRLERSPLMDAKRFIGELESCYREMWRTWCLRATLRPVAATAAGTGAAPAARAPRVLVDGVFFQYFDTGIGRVWRSLLTQWQQDGFGERVLLLDRGGTAPKIRGVRVRRIAGHDYGRLAQDRALLQRICDEEGATVFMSSYYTTPLATPVVMMVYDMVPETLGMDLNLPEWREKAQCVAGARRFIAISRSTARDLRRFYPSIEPARITVANVGVDPMFRPATVAEVDRFCDRHGLRKPYFLVVGDRVGYKNVDLFFRAFAGLAGRARYAVVCVGGHSELEPQQQAACEGSELRLLRLSDDDLMLAYCGALALVYPSFHEGFGMPVIEALACGCPVITTSHASLPEAGGDAAVFVNPADADGLAAALGQVQHGELRASLVAKGLRHACKFTWTGMAQRVEAVLRDLQ